MELVCGLLELLRGIPGKMAACWISLAVPERFPMKLHLASYRSSTLLKQPPRTTRTTPRTTRTTPRVNTGVPPVVVLVVLVVLPGGGSGGPGGVSGGPGGLL